MSVAYYNSSLSRLDVNLARRVKLAERLVQGGLNLNSKETMGKANCWKWNVWINFITIGFNLEKNFQIYRALKLQTNCYLNWPMLYYRFLLIFYSFALWKSFGKIHCFNVIKAHLLISVTGSRDTVFLGVIVCIVTTEIDIL